MGMDNMPAPASLSDRALIVEVKRLAACERQATAALILSLAELDARRLYLGEGCASLFSYCTQVLHLAEHAAYHRIEAARAGRRFPLVLERLVAGEVTLTAIGLLAQHLTADNCRELLDAACHRSKREVEEIVARLRPKPDERTSIRKLTEPPPLEPLALEVAAPNEASSNCTTACPLLRGTTHGGKPRASMPRAQPVRGGAALWR